MWYSWNLKYRLSDMWAWLHPRRAARALKEVPLLQQSLEQTETQLLEATETNSTLLSRLAEMEKAAEEAQRQTELYRHRAEKLEVQLQKAGIRADELQAELDAERAEADMVVEQINSRLEAVAAMQQQYEQRIAHLRHALQDAKARLDARADYDAMSELTMIDINPPTPKEPATTPAPQKSELAAPDSDSEPSDWVLPLPDK